MAKRGRPPKPKPPEPEPARIEIPQRIVDVAVRSWLERAAAAMDVPLDNIKRFEDGGDELVIVTREGQVKTVLRSSIAELEG
jgi:hypothetical protein